MVSSVSRSGELSIKHILSLLFDPVKRKTLFMSVIGGFAANSRDSTVRGAGPRHFMALPQRAVDTIQSPL